MINHATQINETYLTMLMDASPNLIVITNGKTIYSANKALLDFTEFKTLEDFLAHHDCICDFFEPYADNALLTKMDTLSWIEYALMFPNASLAYMRKEGKISAFKVHVGKITINDEPLYTAIFNDVTELEMQKERYLQAIQGSQIGLWDWNLEENTIFFGVRWKEMIGFKDNELPNVFASWQDRVHPEDLPMALAAIDDNVSGRTSFYQCTHRMLHKDGHWVWIDDRGKTFFNQEGKPTRMVGVHNDVSRIKESEAKNHLYALRSTALLKLPELNESQEEATFMQSALEMAEDITHSLVSFIHFVNDGEKTIELVTWSHRTLTHYCHAVHATHYPVKDAGIWANALRERKPFVVNDYPSYADKHGLPEGHAALHRFISIPVMEDGNVVMLCGIGNKACDYDQEDVESVQIIANEIWRLVQRKRNLAKLKLAQELLIAQSRNAAMGEMVSMIAHQWRQPISVIGMCANNMLLDIELENIDTKEFDKQLHDILFQTDHLSSTIDDFRNFFKPNKHKESVSVKSILEDALKLLEKSFENHLITLSLHVNSDTAIMLHKRELLQVFLNILKNAKEALEQHKIEQGIISIFLDEDDESLYVKICDNGGGIAPEIIGRIFEPYFSTKSEKNGTGLGLYMSKTIVEKHLLGELKAYNHDDGACFEIILPKNISEIEETSPEDSPLG